MSSYVVQVDDTWESIADAQCISEALLLQANGRSPDASNEDPATGDVIVVPDPVDVCVAPDENHTVQTTPADLLEAALDQLNTQAANFARVAITEASVRTAYLARIAKMSQDLRAAAQNGDCTYEAAAETANKLRNVILEEQRALSTAVGRAFAESEKATGRTLQELVDKTLEQSFQGRGFNDLSAAERTQLWDNIIEASGRGSTKMLKFLPKLKLAGRACIILTLAISAYTIWTAKNKVRTGLHETIVLGSGFASGAAAGALAGLWCGPGAFVCVTAFFIVGGIAGAIAGEATDSALDAQLNELAGWLGADDGQGPPSNGGAPSQPSPSDSSDALDGGVPSVGAVDDDVE